MEYRQLGHSGLKVSAITLGTMTFGGEGEFSKIGNSGVKEAKAIIDFALDNGINLLDTANMYSSGRSEEIIGEVLNGKRPNGLLISSKARMPVGNGANDEGFSRYHLIREVETSLKRLRTDVIDIYYMHEWDGITPVEEMLETLDTLIKQGKIRYIGCSNFSGWHIMKSLSASKENGYQKFITQQIHYTLEAREAEYELLPIGIDQGLGALIWSPLAGGLLAGKYTRDKKTQVGSRFSNGWNEPPIRDYDRLWNIVDALNEIASKKQIAAAQVALAWLLTRPSVSSLVIGTRTLEQLESNIAAADLQLTPDEIKKLDEISQPPLIYPYWHQANFAENRLSEADLVLLRNHI